MIKLPQSSWPALLILVLCIGGCLLQAQAKRVKKGDCQICKNLVNNFIDVSSACKIEKRLIHYDTI